MKKILVVSPVVSHPARSGNSVRIAQMVGSLTALGCEIHFLLCPIPEIRDRRHQQEMQAFYGKRYRELNQGRTMVGGLLRRAWSIAMRMGLRKFRFAKDTTITTGLFTPANQAEFQQIVAQVDPDVLLFEYVLTAELAACLPAGRTKVVDTHDRFTDRNRRIRAAGGTGIWWSLSARQEQQLLAQFDCAIAIQQSEFDLFTQDLANAATRVALVDILDAPAQHHAGATPANAVVGYIGSDNQHNVEGLFAFIEHHWPKILAALPQATLVVAGGINSPQPIAGVHFVGRVDDLWEDFYKDCSIIVNPCVTGTGLKIKTIEAMSYGMPVVTTDEGCSGIESAIGQGLLSHRMHSDELHRSCIELLQDAQRRSAFSADARRYVEERIRHSVRNLKSILED